MKPYFVKFSRQSLRGYWQVKCVGAPDCQGIAVVHVKGSGYCKKHKHLAVARRVVVVRHIDRKSAEHEKKRHESDDKLLQHESAKRTAKYGS